MSLNKYKEHLERDGILIYPTETLWGVGVNPFSQDAVDKVFELKQRPESMAISVLIAGMDALEDLTDLTDVEENFLKEVWPGPVTAVLPVNTQANSPAKKLANEIVPNGFIGIRYTDHPFLNEFLGLLEFPLTTTSANISGQPPASSRESLAWVPQTEDNVIVEGYEVSSPNSLGSTVIKLDDGKLSVLRKGDFDIDKLSSLADKFGFEML